MGRTVGLPRLYLPWLGVLTSSSAGILCLSLGLLRLLDSLLGGQSCPVCLLAGLLVISLKVYYPLIVIGLSLGPLVFLSLGSLCVGSLSLGLGVPLCFLLSIENIKSLPNVHTI